MANRRSGSSWSLFGEGEVYSEDVDPFKALYGVRKEEFKGIYQTKGMACSVYVKEDERPVAYFVTWSGVTRDLLNKPTQVNRFSSQQFGKYTAPVDSNSTVETFGHFSFLRAGSIFASLSSKKVFIVAFKPFEQEEDLEAYCFVGSEKLTLKLDTKTHKLVTFSEEDRQKLELSPSSVLGAPIIVKNKNISPRNGGRWCVVGVVGLSREGELCPHFVTNEIFGLSGPSAQTTAAQTTVQQTTVQPPISQTPEDSTNPPAGEAVDASGLSGPSAQTTAAQTTVQPPISQTPENSTNPPAGEAVGASGMDSKMKRRRKEETASEISGDEMSLSAVAGRLLKIVISAQGLEGEKLEDFNEMLTAQVKFLEKYHHYSTDTVNGVAKLIDHLEQAFQLLLKTLNLSSLVIIVDCQTLKGLDHLWNDYLSGHLNTMAEQCLVTDEMKQKLGLETISLKTTINEENYLICRKFLTQIPGEAESALLSCQHGLLDQGSCTKEMNTSAGYTVVKKQDTSWAMRMEKAKVSRSALHRASINGQYEEVNRHLKSGANVDERDQFLLTPLHLACWYGHESVVKLLLDHNADVNAVDRFQFTPLQKAERRNHQSIIQLLLEHDAKPSLQQPAKDQVTSCAMRKEKAKVSRSALHRASINGQYEEVNTHLKNGANVDERDQFSLTPLHLACWYGHESVVKLLLDHHADVNAVDRFQFTPLQKAERFNHQSIIQLLLDHDAKLSFQQPLSLRTFAKGTFLRMDSHSGFNQLQAAVLQGDYDSVYKASTFLENFVEEMKCKTISNNASIFPGKSAVDILSPMKWRTVEDLYQRLVAVDETLSELHLCAKSGDVEKVIELVLNDGIDVNIAARSNITPLLWSSPMSSGVLIKTLIDLGADVNCQTMPSKEVPLLFATSSNNYMVAGLLLEHGANVNIQDSEGNAPLLSSVRQGFFNISQLIVNAGFQSKLRNKARETLLPVAVKQDNKADADIQDCRGEAPLHKAVMSNNVPLVKLLLENKAAVNIQDQRGEMPLHKAVMLKDVPLVNLLLENKAGVNIQDQRGEIALHKAVTLKDVPLVNLLLENKAVVNTQDQRGETPLHKAVTLKDVPLLNLLLKNKADVNIQDQRKETPLHKAITLREIPLVNLLLENKASVNVQDRCGDTPLHNAVTQQDVPLVNLLLENKADANVQDGRGETPLHKAVSLKDVPLIKLLLENKADANIQDRGKETPLHKAIRLKDVPLVNLLLENKADANIQDQWKETPLHKAITLKDIPLVKLLLENKADANIQDRCGETPLHNAVTQKDVPLVNLLLENKADTNIQDQWKETPLHKAVIQEDVSLVKLLVENKAGVDIRNQEGESPLHTAVTLKDEPVIKLLLEALLMRIVKTRGK